MAVPRREFIIVEVDRNLDHNVYSQLLILKGVVARLRRGRRLGRRSRRRGLNGGVTAGDAHSEAADRNDDAECSGSSDADNFIRGAAAIEEEGVPKQLSAADHGDTGLGSECGGANGGNR